MNFNNLFLSNEIIPMQSGIDMPNMAPSIVWSLKKGCMVHCDGRSSKLKKERCTKL